MHDSFERKLVGTRGANYVFSNLITKRGTATLVSCRHFQYSRKKFTLVLTLLFTRLEIFLVIPHYILKRTKELVFRDTTIFRDRSAEQNGCSENFVTFQEHVLREIRRKKISKNCFQNQEQF